MTIQKTTITAKSMVELNMRVQDLANRGWDLVKVLEPKETEHKHFGFKETKIGFRRKYVGSDVQQKFTAVMKRDYQPVTN